MCLDSVWHYVGNIRFPFHDHWSLWHYNLIKKRELTIIIRVILLWTYESSSIDVFSLTLDSLFLPSDSASDSVDTSCFYDMASIMSNMTILVIKFQYESGGQVIDYYMILSCETKIFGNQKVLVSLDR